jgi:hypothetical protein
MVAIFVRLELLSMKSFVVFALVAVRFGSGLVESAESARERTS